MSNKYYLRSALIFTFILLHFSVYCDIKLPQLVGDHMVLQRDVALPIWGWAEPGEDVTILFQNQRISTQADANGDWKITLAPEKAGGPYDMVISGKNTIRIKDILMGDVWLCSGQSNMEWKMGMLKDTYAKEIAAAKNNQVRQILVEKQIQYAPSADFNTSGWKSTTPETILNFTAVGYFFGKHLNEQYNVPIGLILSAWGGTVAEAWTSPEALKNFPEFREFVENMNDSSLQKVKSEYEESLAAWNKKQRQIIAQSKLQEKDWAKLKFNDAAWEEMELPVLWESAGLNNLDGIVWFRKTVDIPKKLAGKPLTLSLGPIDDEDSTLFNGKLIGKTKGYDQQRNYSIPGKLVKAGKNVIAIKVVDNGGGGGIYGNKEALKISSQNEEIPLHGKWRYKVSVAFENQPKNPNDPNKPAVLYNGMISPLIPYAIKGTIWYQGESNASRALQYQKLFPALITDWRSKWEQGDFPFLFVQLANFMKPKEQPEESSWAELREAQMKTLSLPNTGMAVIIDIGEEKDIHPKNKLDVGLRLALAARKIAYKEDLVYSGPIFDSVEKDGNSLKITFKHTGSGLISKNGEELKEFAIAGADGKFYNATARIENGIVRVSSEKVSNPIEVRYAWADNPEGANLYNKEGLPASPFRSERLAE